MFSIRKEFLNGVYSHLMSYDPDYDFISNLIEKFKSKYRRLSLNNLIKSDVNQSVCNIMRYIYTEIGKVHYEDFEILKEFIFESNSSVILDEVLYVGDEFYLGEVLNFIFSKLDNNDLIKCGISIIGSEIFWRKYKGTNNRGCGNRNEITESRQVFIRANILRILGKYLDITIILPPFWYMISDEIIYGDQSYLDITQIKYLVELKKAYGDI